MKIVIIGISLFLSLAFTLKNDKEENTRYILIEAQCKPGFNALADFKEKVILTKVFKRKFEDAFEMVNAEPNLIIDFEVALEGAYPDQRNQVKDILVYMMNSEKEAKELYNRKLKQFETLETGVIILKLK